MNKRQWLIDIRKSKNLNHEEVAVRARIERSTYTKIENGATPSVAVAKRIAETLDFKWTNFFEENCDLLSQYETA